MQQTPVPNFAGPSSHLRSRCEEGEDIPLSDQVPNRTGSTYHNVEDEETRLEEGEDQPLSDKVPNRTTSTYDNVDDEEHVGPVPDRHGNTEDETMAVDVSGHTRASGGSRVPQLCAIVTGVGGTGKSHVVRLLIAKIRALGFSILVCGAVV